MTKGQPFERNDLFSLSDALDIKWTHVKHLAARVFFSPELAKNDEALVLYDMLGIRLRRLLHHAIYWVVPFSSGNASPVAL